MDRATRQALLLDGWPEFLSTPPRARREIAFPALFASLAAPRMFNDLGPIIDEFEPDVMLHEPCEMATVPLATARGIPHVAIGFGCFVSEKLLNSAAAPLRELWDRVDQAPLPAAGLYEHLYLHPFPASLAGPPPSTTVRRVRPTAFDGGVGEPPPWVGTLGADRPAVYITFGTELGGVAPWPELFDAVAGLDIDAVVTVGSNFDRTRLASVPSNVRVEDYVPQRYLMARAGAVISHAGSGTLIGTAIAGLPHVCLPFAADQFENADALAATGAGITIEPADIEADRIADAVRRALEDDRVAEAAAALAGDFQHLPDLSQAATDIESIGAVA